MNYEEARQIGPDGPAPGKWNWSNSNDSISERPYTAWPCFWPDSPVPDDWQPGKPLERMGRERCDHDTREEAERHHYEASLAALRWHPIDKATARHLTRCDYPGCTEWADGASAWLHGWPWGDFCLEHANVEAVRLTRPFVPGSQEIHS